MRQLDKKSVFLMKDSTVLKSNQEGSELKKGGLRLLKERSRLLKKTYEVMIIQTPKFRQTKGYKQVYRMNVRGSSHLHILEDVFRTFNVKDSIPNDYQGRYMGTGDIIYIDEGRQGTSYYQLQPGGWKKISRIHVL